MFDGEALDLKTTPIRHIFKICEQLICT
jgi:hypothetical protein